MALGTGYVMVQQQCMIQGQHVFTLPVAGGNTDNTLYISSHHHDDAYPTISNPPNCLFLAPCLCAFRSAMTAVISAVK